MSHSADYTAEMMFVRPPVTCMSHCHAGIV